MLDDKTRFIKLAEAFGAPTQVARWLAERDTRSGLGRLWAGLIYLNIPYYIVFGVSLLLYFAGELARPQIVFLLLIALALYSYGTRKLLLTEFMFMINGISDDLDELQRRIKRMEGVQDESKGT